MLIAFVGAPCSGKTTTAARLFAELKEQGLPVEFLAEYARMYIAEAKTTRQPLVLNDEDQLTIMSEQFRLESILAHDTTSVVIADSSAISALLYMTPEARSDNSKAVQIGRQAAAQYDLVFRCGPVKPGVWYDPNRLHSFEQSLEIDTQINDIFNLVHLDPAKVHNIAGTTKSRANEAASIVTRSVLDQSLAKVS